MKKYTSSKARLATFIVLISHLSFSRAILDVCIGNSHSCFLAGNNNVYCTGDNSMGQLGLGNSISSIGSSPSDFPLNPVILPGKVAKIECGTYSVCALLQDQINIYCWGSSSTGGAITGDNSTVMTFIPKNPVSLGSATIIDFGIGDSHGCALLFGGIIKCWGSSTGLNNFGQIGAGDNMPHYFPVSTLTLFSNATEIATQLSVGYQHNCVISNYHHLVCWGNGQYGQLGRGFINATGYSPTDFPLLYSAINNPSIMTITQISCGFYTTSVIYSNGLFASAGDGSFGSVNYAQTANVGVFTVLHFFGAQSVSASQDKTCALYNGSVICSGLNTNYALGITVNGGIFGSSGSETQVPLNSDLSIISIAHGNSGYDANCFIADVPDNDVTQAFCYGDNSFGKVGLGVNSTAIPLSNDAFTNRIKILCGNNIVDLFEGETCDPPSPGSCSAYCELFCSGFAPLNSVCINGQWVIDQTFVNVNITSFAGIDVTINGNFIMTSNGTIILDSATNISVNGCAILSGNLVISQSLSDGVTFTPLQSHCIQGSFDNITTLSVCQKVSQNFGSSNTYQVMSLTITDDCSKKTSKILYIVAGCVVGAVLILTGIFIYGGYRFHKKYAFSVAFKRRETMSGAYNM